MLTLGLHGSGQLNEEWLSPLVRVRPQPPPDSLPLGTFLCAFALATPGLKCARWRSVRWSMGRGILFHFLPKELQTWRLAEIFLQSICVPDDLDISVCKCQSAPSRTDAPGKQEAWRSHWHMYQQWLILQILSLVISPNGIRVQVSMNGENQEFGALAISKLVWWLGREEKADVEEKNSCHSYSVCNCPFYLVLVSCDVTLMESVKWVRRRKPYLNPPPSHLGITSSDCVMPTEYTVKHAC